MAFGQLDKPMERNRIKLLVTVKTRMSNELCVTVDDTSFTSSNAMKNISICWSVLVFHAQVIVTHVSGTAVINISVKIWTFWVNLQCSSEVKFDWCFVFVEKKETCQLWRLFFIYLFYHKEFLDGHTHLVHLNKSSHMKCINSTSHDRSWLCFESSV